MNLSTLYKKLTNGKYIIGFIITIFSIINFSNAGSYTITGTGAPIMSIPLNNFPATNCNVTVNCTLSSPSTAYIKFAASYHAKVGNAWYSYNTSNLNSSPLTVPGGSSTEFSYDLGSVTIPSDYGGVCYGVSLFRTNTCQNCNSIEWSCTFNGDSILTAGGSTTCPDCPNCPEVNTGEILSGYILESEIDTNYCVGNGLCPNECGSGEEITGTNRSSLYINNIQYPGAPTIRFTIPEEIEREQNTDEEETNIDVIGYGYDQDKMQQMVNTQYYKPTAEEMSRLMEKIADFLPLIAVALLITRIRRVVKKVF